MKGKLIVSEKNKLIAIPVEQIIRLESSGTYTIIYCKDNRKLMSCKYLKTIHAELDGKMFLRVHKMHVVNLIEVREYEKGRGGYVIMSDKSNVPVSQRKKSHF